MTGKSCLPHHFDILPIFKHGISFSQKRTVAFLIFAGRKSNE